jgi:predicted flap endonuclease-1-like 5' DNA nuclease
MASVSEVRALYYQYLEQGLSPEEAAAKAEGRSVAPKVPVAPPISQWPDKPHPTIEPATSTGAHEPPPDDLTRIRGVGSDTAKKLEGLGITKFAQLAALTDEQVKVIDTKLGLNGRIARESWTTKAKNLL